MSITLTPVGRKPTHEDEPVSRFRIRVETTKDAKGPSRTRTFDIDPPKTIGEIMGLVTQALMGQPEEKQAT